MNLKKAIVLLLAVCLILPGLALAAEKHVTATPTLKILTTGGTETHDDDEENNHQDADNEADDDDDDNEDRHLKENNEAETDDDNDEEKDQPDDDNETEEDDDHTSVSPTVTTPVLNMAVPVTTDYDARIAALEKQVTEQNREIERQGDILNQIMDFLKSIFNWK